MSIKAVLYRLAAPIFWRYWTQPRIRLFRRQLKQVRQHDYEFYSEEESDYSK